MAGYHKPKCDCGDDLVYQEERVYLVTTKITQKGKLFKKHTMSHIENASEDRLHCRKCFSEYRVLKDNKGRVIRGDII